MGAHASASAAAPQCIHPLCPCALWPPCPGCTLQRPPAAHRRCQSYNHKRACALRARGRARYVCFGHLRSPTCVPIYRVAAMRFFYTKRLQLTIEILSLGGDSSFRANRGSETIKNRWGIKNLLGATVRSTALNFQPPWRRAELPAPWRRPSVARSRRRVARSWQALRASRTVIVYDRVSTLADLAPSVLNQIAL